MPAYEKPPAMPGDIYLQSGQTLFIDEGAVVYATVYALHAENIKILGRGILDNGKNKAKILFDTSVEGNNYAVANAKREHAVNFVACKNVEIDGITIRDALTYILTRHQSRNFSFRMLLQKFNQTNAAVARGTNNLYFDHCVDFLK
jgi:polygalacturonase